ncbi:aldehyde dehydrogenase [Candidatus Epulonipiscium viviparus]|uniref:aldehyde dehydrogenase n=1 Tax=Candidatus Epulonipiscium viviparus TaxID=420336 RepID=UPI00016C0F23|nr:aldehyde dehydrogenase [Candidatus Epulopiscium viviparus]
MIELKCLVDGKLVSAADGAVIKVTSSYDGSLVGTVPSFSKEDARVSLEAAQAAKDAWASLTFVKRAEYVSELADIIDRHSDELVKLLTNEHGKTLAQAQGEVAVSAKFLRYAVESARRVEGEVITSELENEHAFITRVPYGVVVGIVAWNFPLALAARKIGNALVCGNTMVVKPPSETPLTVMKFAEFIEKESSIPKGVLSFVTGSGRVCGDALVRNEITQLVTLTGSTGAGIEVFKAAAENVVDVHLELGGKAPFIVMDDADIDKAARCAAVARYDNCGQICTCNERMYVHEKVYDEFKNKFVEHSKKYIVGDPTDANTTIGPKVSKAEVAKLKEMKEKSIEQGGKVVYEMTADNVPTAEGNWFYPTVLEVSDNKNILMQEEIFGPMVAMMKISSLEEAIKYANDCEYGLSAYLFSDSVKNAMIATQKLEFGELYINRENGELLNGFHNGYKKSGLGGEDGKYGLEGYLQKKMVYLNYNY